MFIYKLMTYIGAICAGITLILAIIMFIKFKIPKVILEVTGIQEKRRIAEIHKENTTEKKRKFMPQQTAMYNDESVEQSNSFNIHYLENTTEEDDDEATDIIDININVQKEETTDILTSVLKIDNEGEDMKGLSLKNIDQANDIETDRLVKEETTVMLINKREFSIKYNVVKNEMKVNTNEIIY